MKCGNCDIEMHKHLEPIVFSPRPPRTRTWWKCPKCGAKLPRMADEGELDAKPTVFSWTHEDEMRREFNDFAEEVKARRKRILGES